MLYHMLGWPPLLLPSTNLQKPPLFHIGRFRSIWEHMFRCSKYFFILVLMQHPEPAWEIGWPTLRCIRHSVCTGETVNVLILSQCLCVIENVCVFFLCVFERAVQQITGILNKLSNSIRFEQIHVFFGSASVSTEISHAYWKCSIGEYTLKDKKM